MTQVSLITAPELLIEADETRAFLNFTLSEPPPPEGITVTIDAPNLDDFNLSQVQAEGGEIVLEDGLVEQLNTNLDDTRAPEVPGAAVAIVSPAGSWFGASGVANVEDNIPLEPDDRFEIGSITKTFTATVILQLVEEGVLSLEDNLTDWLPESVTADIPNANNITLENLLQHTSGMADYVDVLFAQAASNPLVFTQDWQPAALVDLIDGQPALFEPGESFFYSNTNFLLLGIVIESATNNNIAAEIRDRIIEPLELDNTFFAGEEEIPGGYVSGYWDFDGDGTLNNINLANLSWAWSTGAMVSNTEDLDTFARNLFAGDLLQPETLEMMLDTIPATDNNNYSSYGLGVGTIESPNRFWYIHRGQTLGYRSNMWYSPQDDLTYIELTNGFSNDNLVRDILPAYREGINDATLEFTITESEASISIPLLNDGTTEGEEIAAFTLESGAGYEIDPENNSGELAIADNLEIPPNLGFGIFPEVANEGETVTFFFEAGGLIPDDGSGLYLYLDSDLSNSLSQFDLDSIVGGEFIVLNADDSGFAIRIFTEGDSIEIPVISDDILEEPLDLTFNLKTRDDISPEDLAAVETEAQIDDYELNLQMFRNTVSIVDNSNPVIEPEIPEPEINAEIEAIFGSLDADTIEVEGSDQLIFAGDLNDLVDLATGEGNNRIYAGNGNDTLILGESDRILAGDGSDRIFVTNGGNNIITGGAGADQFWIASAEIPEATNIITDFTLGEDVVGIAGLGIGLSDLDITDLEDDTLISTGGNDLAIIKNTSANLIGSEANFAFA
ncbi:MAG: serine hydrolase [Cyanobacteria bacterium P01_G01_bin.67]